MKILVDACVLGHAITTQPAKCVESINWGGRTFLVELPASHPVPHSTGWLGDQIDAIPRVAQAARDGYLELYIAAEVATELLPAPPDAIRRGPTHLFHGIKFKRCPDPFKYGRIVIAAFDTREQATSRLREFAESLSDPEIRQLDSVLGGNKAVDAFHILTAARARLDGMLTTDRKLINSFKNAVIRGMTVEVLSPRELADRLVQ